MNRIAIIPGDGIGPEITAEALKVLKAVQERSGLELQLIEFDYRAESHQKSGVSLSDAQIEELRTEFDAILLGAWGDARLPGMIQARETFRRLFTVLDLYVHYRPVKLLNERFCLLHDKKPEAVNFVVFSDNSEGCWAFFTGDYKPGTPDEVTFRQFLNTRRGVERIIRHAFEYARLHGLKRLTLSSKGNSLFWEEDLLERVFEELRQEYPEIESHQMPVNQLLAQLLKHPERFDVIITNHLYGDVIADLGAQLQGGIGLAACAHLHPGKVSLFMPAPNAVNNRGGQNAVNPIGAISSAALMLEHLGLDQEANWVQGAVKCALDTNNTTHDLGGRLGTRQVGDFVAQQIKKGAC